MRLSANSWKKGKRFKQTLSGNAYDLMMSRCACAAISWRIKPATDQIVALSLLNDLWGVGAHANDASLIDDEKGR